MRDAWRRGFSCYGGVRANPKTAGAGRVGCNVSGSVTAQQWRPPVVAAYWARGLLTVPACPHCGGVHYHLPRELADGAFGPLVRSHCWTNRRRHRRTHHHYILTDVARLAERARLIIHEVLVRTLPLSGREALALMRMARGEEHRDKSQFGLS